MKRLLVAVLAASLIASSAVAQVPADKIGSLATSVATKGQVQTSLGAPAFQGQSPDGRSSLIYTYPVPLTATNKTTKHALVVFIFDAHDVLSRKAVYASTLDVPPDAKALASISANAFAANPPPAGAAAGEALDAENILLPVPAGFKQGSNQDQPHVRRMAEYLQGDESFDSWTRLITENIYYTQHGVDPAQLPTGMRPGWSASCPNSEIEEVSKSATNGYPTTLWLFQCPLNPATKKPENMWVKTIAGADALYSVQYAFRLPVTEAARTEAMTYLNNVSVCDTRGAAHPCPSLTRIP